MKHGTYKWPEGYPSGGPGETRATTIPAGCRILSFALALCLLLTMGLVAPGPIAVQAELPQLHNSAQGQPWDGIDFDNLIGDGIYYGTYDHATKLSDTTEGTVVETEGEATPMLWRVMGEDNAVNIGGWDAPYCPGGSGNLTLWSEYVLDTRQFMSNSVWNHWNASGYADWLQDTFIGNFAIAEQGLIAKDIAVHSGAGVSGRANRRFDQLFYLPWATGAGTDVIGLDTNDTVPSTLSYRAQIGYLKENNQAVCYWLRSPYSSNSANALYVNTDGDVDIGQLVGNNVKMWQGVRPAFQINPSSIIFTSKIADGANIANGEAEKVDGYYSPAGEVGRKNFKLTVVGGNNGADVGTLTGVPASGTTVSLNSSASSFWLTDLEPNQTGGDYTVNHKIVSNTGTRAIKGYGFTEAEALTHLEVDTSSLGDGTYTVYVWLQKNNALNSHEGTTPQYFTLNVDSNGDTYDLALTSQADPLDFGSEEETYAPINPKTVNITTNVPGFHIRLGGDNPSSFKIINESATGFDIAPVHGLAAGTYEATVTVAGNYAKPQTLDVKFVVMAGSSPSASLTLGNMNPDIVEVNQPYSKSIPVDYQNGTASSLNYTVTGLPVGLSGYSLGHSGTITGTPTEAGTFTVNVAVNDGMGASDSGSYTLEVTAAATQTHLTLATPTDLTVTEGEPFTKTFSVSYTGTDPLAYTITDLPEGVDYDSGSGEVSGAATENGAFLVDVMVTDGSLQANGSFTLTVEPGGIDPGPGPGPNPNTYSVTVQTDGNGSANASPNPAAEGEIVTLTATANTGCRFKEWQVISGNTVVIDKPRQSTATFQMPGNAVTVKAVFEHGGEVPGGNGTIPGPGGGGATGARSSSRGGSSGGSTYTPPRKTALPASAFSWDGERTLIMNHDSISPLGLLAVQWDGWSLTRGEDYAVCQGSVIIRFSENFIATQSPDDHTVRVEFLNHNGEITVTVGEAGTASTSDDLFDSDTHNPNTGGYPQVLTCKGLKSCKR